MATQDIAAPACGRSPTSGTRDSRDREGRGLAVVVVGAVALIAWLATGVPASAVASFVAFEALVVLLPGCALYVSLSRPPHAWTHVVAVGWPLGYALEIGWFALTASLGMRDWLRLLPLVALVVTGPVLVRLYGRSWVSSLRSALSRARSPFRGAGSRAPVAFALTVGLALGLLVLRYFVHYPLPGPHSVAYLPDNVYAMSVAAEARNHWPMTEPYAAGEALHFYPGVFIHIAAVSQATGIAISTVVLRLLAAPPMVLIAFQLYLLCRGMGASRWVGVGAAALYFLTGELSLDATRFESFGVDFFNLFTEGSNTTLGICFFLALLIMIQRQLAIVTVAGAQRTATSGSTAGLVGAAGPFVIFTLIALGGGMTKTMLLGDVFGGLVLCLLVNRSLGARIRRLLCVDAALALLCLGLVYFSTLAGGRSPFRIEPFAFVDFTVFAPLYPAHTAVRFLLLAAAGVLACALLFVPLVGSVWLLRERVKSSPFAVILLATFVSGLGAYAVLAGRDDNELDFLSFGYLAMVPLSAVGMGRLWARMSRELRRQALLMCAATLIAGLAAAGSSALLTSAGTLAKASAIHASEGLLGAKRVHWLLWYLIAYGLMLGLVAGAAFRLERHLAPVVDSRKARVLACAIPLLLVLGLVKPLGTAAPQLWKAAAGESPVERGSSENQGLTAALYSGLLWVRAHTRPCDVLAVSNHYRRSHDRDPRYFYYSAFTERRVYLESWAYPAFWGRSQPFPARLALNNQATIDGSPAALRELGRMGVSYVLIDKAHGGGAGEPASVSTLVFSNGALDVYRLTGRPACR